MRLRKLMRLALATGAVSLVGCPTEDTTIAEDPCIEIDRVRGLEVPPAGVAIGFRAIRCDGGALPPLTEDQVKIINDETNVPFNDSSEGGSASAPGPSDEVRAYSILALDLSASIFAANAAQDVVSGALAYIDATLVNPAETVDHQIALLAFGSPDQLELISDFTSSPSDLQSALSGALAEGSRGTTDLYGAYIDAHMRIAQVGGAAADALTERFVVLLTDGTHEAGNTEALRAQALEALASADATVFSIGIEGDYDSGALAELASDPSGFLSVGEPGDLTGAFDSAAAKALALARSNYVVGVCTPVALGQPTVTVEVNIGTSRGVFTVPYSTTSLTGNFENCDPSEVASALGGGY